MMLRWLQMLGVVASCLVGSWAFPILSPATTATHSSPVTIPLELELELEKGRRMRVWQATVSHNGETAWALDGRLKCSEELDLSHYFYGFNAREVLAPRPSGPHEDVPRNSNFTLNAGKLLDTLPHDATHMFEQEPDLSLFTPDVCLSDPKVNMRIHELVPCSRPAACPANAFVSPQGIICKGKTLYRALFASLRLVGRVAGMHPRVAVTSARMNEVERTVELRLTMRFGGAENVGLATISTYRLDSEGMVYSHEFNNVLKRSLYEYSSSWSSLLANIPNSNRATAGNY
jgi:hypothetical protein